ncbi:Cof-type HAD-IIB family hydrolase [Mycoplasmoides pirum]|uniref:Cof-type HAD-IIB family hydrolase n=1 Tax=Mycoplasmoides pirum TaxID=2122 RepID=UPI000488888C|nr:Cof-type HAD-IIB family hydrolase [Mycoplasmoides pirum]
MSKEINWITCDLDGTLLRYENESHIIEDESIKAIQKLKSKKIYFTIATGRHYEDALYICNKYNLLNEYLRYIIGCNGATIYDAINKEIIFQTTLDQNKLLNSEKILKFLKKQKLEVILAAYKINRDVIMLKNSNSDSEIVNEYIKYEGNFTHTENNFEFAENFNKEKNILKTIFFFKKNQVFDIQNILDQIITTFNIDKNDLIVTSNQSIEYNQSNVSKGNAILFLSKKLGLDINKTLSIGDSGNDISMFNTTKYSATLENSIDIVKSNATNVFDSKASTIVKDVIDYFVFN